MYVVKADNIGEAYRAGMSLVREEGVEEHSRNGKAKVLPGPLVTCYSNPKRHVLMDPKRDANPFFHLYEAMWMLAGKRDILQLKEFNSNISMFSDNGETLNGAYGYRWRHYFGTDQLISLITLLEQDDTTRRAVLGMWDPSADLGYQVSKDLPCNTHIYFRVRENNLDMTVCCRSNDLVWGCYGANAVHMSVLHEYVAGKLNKRQGTYYQMSNNAHVYERHYELLDQPSVEVGYPYASTTMEAWRAGWDRDCMNFVENPYQLPNAYNTRWFKWTMAPLGLAHQAYKLRSLQTAIDFTRQIESEDWRVACMDWLQRRVK